MKKASAENPCIVTPTIYNQIEQDMEEWYQSQSNPYRNYFENGVRVGYDYIVKMFDLVIEESDDVVVVSLVSKINPDLIVFNGNYLKGSED
jgi:hypothetical protein